MSVTNPPTEVGVRSVHLSALVCGVLIASCLVRTTYGQASDFPSLALPDAPAFTFLGVSPTTISRPVTPRAFASSLINSIDSSGAVLQGVALDVAPWTYIPGVSIPLEDYQDNRFKYALANTQVSLATVRASGESGNANLGVGLRFSLWNQSDPMQDPMFTDSLRLATAVCAARLGQALATGELTEAAAASEAETCAGEINQRRRKDWMDTNWNRAGLEMAVATGWQLRESRFSQGEWLGISAWLTGAAPFSSKGQVAFHLRYDRRESVGEIEATDLFAFGVKGFFGSSTFNVFGELSGRHDSEAALSSDKNTLTWAGGIEFQVSDGIWLSTGYGSDMKGPDSGKPSFIIANMRWGVGQGPKIRSPQ